METEERTEPVFGMLASFDLCVIRKFEYLQKGYFPLHFAPNSSLREFRHCKSIVLSTKLADGRACGSHLYDGRRVVAGRL